MLSTVGGMDIEEVASSRRKPSRAAGEPASRLLPFEARHWCRAGVAAAQRDAVADIAPGSSRVRRDRRDARRDQPALRAEDGRGSRRREARDRDNALCRKAELASSKKSGRTRRRRRRRARSVHFVQLEGEVGISGTARLVMATLDAVKNAGVGGELSRRRGRGQRGGREGALEMCCRIRGCAA